MGVDIYDVFYTTKRFVECFEFFLYLKNNSDITRIRMEEAVDEIYSNMTEDERPFLYSHSDSSKSFLRYMDHFLKKNKDDATYSINRDSFKECFSSFVSIFFDDMILCDRSEIEDEDGNSYSYVVGEKNKTIDSFIQKLNDTSAENADLHYKIMNLEQSIADISSRQTIEKQSNSDFDEISHQLIDFIHMYIGGEIGISNFRIQNKSGDNVFETSLLPGIYEGKRPSWFSPLQVELNRENVIDKNVKNTSDGFLRRLFALNLMQSDTKSSIDEKADMLDNERKKNIDALLAADLSNEEKYLKYILLTPGLSRDYMKTLDGCSDLHLDANIIIRLLEQPATSYSKEIIEAFVSKAHKGREYDYKQEVIKELLNGDWVVFAEFHGKYQKMQLVPLDQILELKSYFEKISAILENGKILNRDVVSVPVVNDIARDHQENVSSSDGDAVPNMSDLSELREESMDNKESIDNENMWEQYLSDNGEIDSSDTSWMDDAF